MSGRGLPRGGSAVMAGRIEAPDSLDFFPTPPWATRALVECILTPLGFGLGHSRVWEPACGAGHMSAVLAEYAKEVVASDVHDYGIGAQLGSFVGEGPDVMPPQHCEWIITNPPFNLAGDFLDRAHDEARGVALLVRTAWLESAERYFSIFFPRPPNVVGIFSEGVPMTKGLWNPRASTATSYSWCIWRQGSLPPMTQLLWIPPGRRQHLTRPTDIVRFAGV